MPDRALHASFEIDAEAVGDPVDVVEIRDHLGGVGDRTIRQTQPAQTLDIIPRHVHGLARQLEGVIAEGSIDVG